MCSPRTQFNLKIEIVQIDAFHCYLCEIVMFSAILSVCLLVWDATLQTEITEKNQVQKKQQIYSLRQKNG